ncbi:MAG TPA: formate dehydrogenase accessory sulfurtransferase FdhD [Methanocorpusculum sp.]|nr:formate dehydrogenase accessory sulfurtransferase FdhD [Methanocorpusculum sp.]
MFEDTIQKRHAVRYNDGNVEEFEDSVVVEDVITLYLNGTKYISMVATADSLEELGAGFFIAAGIAKKIKSVCVDGLNVYVEADDVHSVSGVLESAGGFSGANNAGFGVVSVADVHIKPEEIFEIRESLNADVWSRTGGLHSTVLYHQHEMAAIFCDIGRHNTVDKAIGYMVLHSLSPKDCVIGCTGRQPAGMVSKAVNAGLPIIVSRAAATTSGITFAEKSGITLICFTRDRRFTIYAHPERILMK